MNMLTSFFVILFILIGAAVIYIVFGWSVGVYLARKFVFPNAHSLEKTYADSLESGDFTEEEFRNYQFQPFSIESSFGYTLKGVYVPGSDPEKTVVFVHGHTWTWHGMIKYFPPYVKRGYTIVAYNHRYHGDSGGECCTAGFFEKQDLLQVSDWIFSRFPATRIYGAVGESLGAATVLQYMPLDKRLTFVHADCPYSDTENLYRYQLGEHKIPRFMEGITMYFCDRYLKKRCGFGLEDTSPKQSIMESSLPLFLVHGAADDYVPTRMSEEMAAARKPLYPTTLLLVEGAAHAKALATDKELYESELNAFLNEVEGGISGAPAAVR
jgi:uncharacterized protein